MANHKLLETTTYLSFLFIAYVLCMPAIVSLPCETVGNFMGCQVKCAIDRDNSFNQTVVCSDYGYYVMSVNYGDKTKLSISAADTTIVIIITHLISYSIVYYLLRKVVVRQYRKYVARRKREDHMV